MSGRKINWGIFDPGVNKALSAPPIVRILYFAQRVGDRGESDMFLGKLQIVAAFALIISCQAKVVSQTAHCSHAEAESADYEASRLQTWDKLYHSYLRYSGCDDGSIGEGYSVSVARLLAHQWNMLPQAFPLFAGDAEFHRFVLKHINATLADNDLKTIRVNAVHSCPTGGDKYCVQIRRAADNALRDNRR